jgi:hypothetical protein
MSNKTRYFVLTAGAILAVGLTTGLVASFMGLPVAFSRAAGPDELQYVPSDAAVVAYANVRDVLNSEFRQRFRKFEPDTTERDEFQAKTGVNIEEDIHTVVAALMPGAVDGQDWHHDKGVLIIARGRFEQARLEALALEHGGNVEDYQGKRLITHVKDGGEPDMAVGFLDADLIAFGGYTAIKKSIDASAGKNIISNTEMMRQINDLETSSAWAVGHFDAIANAGQIPPEVRSHMPAIQWFSAAGHVNGGVSGMFRAEAKDDASAQNLRDMLRGFVALAKMQAESRPEIKTMVDSVQLSGDGKNVAIAFTIPSELFDALEALGNQHHQRQIEPRQ